MRRSFFNTLALAALLLFCGPAALAQQQPAAPISGSPSPAEINRIIQAFAAKETQFRRALNEYAFKRDAVIQVIGLGGQIAGEYHRVSHFTFDSSGNRYEKIVFFPMPTFAGVSPEDIEDLGGVNPFALEAHKIDQYNFTYVGRERIDELNLYVFDVAPKVKPDPKKTKERFFQGRIWIDDRDLQLVKSRGKGIPETKDNKFPTVETYREQIDGRYWFPTYSYADEDLVFDNGQVMHIRLKVTYKDFKKGRVDIRITDEIDGEELEVSGNKPQAPVSAADLSQVTGGVLNGRALELPAPVYPEEARQKNIRGTVKVEVSVDQDGNVTAAEAVEGPKELREAAVQAAKKARFEPVTLHGQRIRVDGVLVYKF